MASLVTFLVTLVCAVVSGRAEASRGSRLGTNTAPKEALNAIVTVSEDGYMTVAMGLGTPSQSHSAVIDTVSSVNLVDSFEEKKSSTFEAQQCSSKACQDIGNMCHHNPRGACRFSETLSTGVRVKAVGHVGKDNLDMYDRVSGGLNTNNVTIGEFEIGVVDTVTRYRGAKQQQKRPAANVIALGRGPASFVSQTMHLYNGLFSHCLPPSDDHAPVEGSLKFGKQDLENVRYTPLLHKKVGDQYPYIVDLEGISVEGRYVPMPAASRKSTVIDSTTYATLLPNTVFHSFVKEYTAVAAASFGMTAVPNVYNTSLPSSPCFKKRANDVKRLPLIKFHFYGHDVTLDNYGLLNIETGKYDERVFCLAFHTPTPNLLDPHLSDSVIGNAHMQYKLVVYDTLNSRVGFRGNC